MLISFSNLSMVTEFDFISRSPFGNFQFQPFNLYLYREVFNFEKILCKLFVQECLCSPTGKQQKRGNHTTHTHLVSLLPAAVGSNNSLNGCWNLRVYPGARQAVLGGRPLISCCVITKNSSSAKQSTFSGTFILSTLDINFLTNVQYLFR